MGRSRHSLIRQTTIAFGREANALDRLSGSAERSRVKQEEGKGMCRNIRTLFNFAPPATEEEIQAASLQFVRKLSGFNKPSKANEAAFQAAVEEIARVSAGLLAALESSAPPKNREEEADKAKARSAERFSR
jgi:hypothetical protein